MPVLVLYLYDRFSVEGGRSPSEERPSQKGGERTSGDRGVMARMRK
jgi:hypothetical protein